MENYAKDSIVQTDPERTVKVCPKIYTYLNNGKFVTYYWEGAESAIFMDSDHNVITPYPEE